MHSQLQQTLLASLQIILRPLVKLALQTGVGYSEFASVAKTVFVHVATEEYGRRSRPANFSRVSAMTGISRKEVSRIRNKPVEARWTPNMESSPINTLLHHWHFDPEYSDGAGTPRPLRFDGPFGFSALVARYAGDIPPGAVRAALERSGTISEDDRNQLVVGQPFFFAKRVDQDYVRRFGFTLTNLGSTLVHNAEIYTRSDLGDDQKRDLGRFERTVWSEHLDGEAIERFRRWVRDAAPRFLEEGNRLVGESELPREAWDGTPPRAIGVSVFYFEEDQPEG